MVCVVGDSVALTRAGRHCARIRAAPPRAYPRLSGAVVTRATTTRPPEGVVSSRDSSPNARNAPCRLRMGRFTPGSGSPARISNRTFVSVGAAVQQCDGRAAEGIGAAASEPRRTPRVRAPLRKVEFSFSLSIGTDARGPTLPRGACSPRRDRCVGAGTVSSGARWRHFSRTGKRTGAATRIPHPEPDIIER